MGCMPSFYFKPKNYSNVLSYSEKFDKWLGEILLVRVVEKEDYIFKKISNIQRDIL